MKKAKSVKKEIKFNNLIIRLYEVDIKEWLGNSVANVEAYDSDGMILWIIEPPPYSRDYFDIALMNCDCELFTGCEVVLLQDCFSAQATS